MKDVSWTIDDNTAVYTVGGLSVTDGMPDFTVGREVDLTLTFEGSANQSDYESIVEIGEFLFDGAVDTGTDYREVPFYTEYIHDKSPVTSYLWKLEPVGTLAAMKGWWVVVTEITEDSLYRTVGRRLDVTVFVLAPVADGDRDYVHRNFEV